MGRAQLAAPPHSPRINRAAVSGAGERHVCPLPACAARQVHRARCGRAFTARKASILEPCTLAGCWVVSYSRLLRSGVAAPQPIDARFTAGAMVFADDGPVTLIAFGGSVRFYFSRRWSVEPEVLYAR